MADVIRNGDDFTVEAKVIADGLDLPEHAIARGMSNGAITTRFERGEGEDEGRFRLSFFHRERVLRLTVDASGNILSRARFDRKKG
ncbi:hypothetical protein FQV27_07790 [Paracoccus aurantiacus]|uniref:PepSY domain-containing protein n=1 Tax=Paracoccus aurantiacus TaxID=2599412 RepID=A0A5C6S7E7_9RHOB|nr:DUF6522 family protein [Paracoccus aurantiacus]TXB69991.1 hypothetical protein FQV27_07790 [Paracoccus aurantiacus]